MEDGFNFSKQEGRKCKREREYFLPWRVSSKIRKKQKKISKNRKRKEENDVRGGFHSVNLLHYQFFHKRIEVCLKEWEGGLIKSKQKRTEE